jgi:diguanylate cyclase (GGDEF)-like protein
LEAEWRRARRSGSTLAVAIVDVDRFKQFNDLLGHQAGDGCLQRVATTLAASSCRAGDLVARYGGEEFAVLLPATDLSAARKLAEDMRRDIEALQIPSGDGKRLVTVSVGVAAADATLEDTQEALVARADRALYRAKSEGRNRIAWER